MQGAAETTAEDLARELGVDEAGLAVLLERQAAGARKRRLAAVAVLGLGLSCAAVAADYAWHLKSAGTESASADYPALWHARLGLAAPEDDSAAPAPVQVATPAPPSPAPQSAPPEAGSTPGLAGLVARITGGGDAGAATEAEVASAGTSGTGSGSGGFMSRIFGSSDSRTEVATAAPSRTPVMAGDPNASVKINRAPADGCGAGNFCKVD